MPVATTPSLTTWRTRAPGLALALAVALVAYLVNSFVPVVSALLVAIVVGAVLRNAHALPAAAEPGVRYASRTVLRLGVVLLGLQLSVPQVLALGWEAIAVILATVALTWPLTLLAGRLLGVPTVLRTLLATGTAICGASAVAAMSAVLEERVPGAPDGQEEDLEDAAATAVAAVTIFGTLAMLTLPVLARALGMDDHAAGVWLGAGIHEVGQVVAAGGVLGSAVLATAVVTKLGRVVLLAPLVAGVGYTRSRRVRAEVEREVAIDSASVLTGARPTGVAHVRPPLVPAFVLGFLLLVAVRSLLPVPAVVLDVAATASTLLLTVAMVALGTGVNVRALLTRGGPAMLLGLVAAVLGAGVSLIGVLLLL